MGGPFLVGLHVSVIGCDWPKTTMVVALLSDNQPVLRRFSGRRYPNDSKAGIAEIQKIGHFHELVLEEKTVA